MSKDVTIQRFSTISNRTFMLTLQYTFNATRDRYRGQGAGKNELNRTVIVPAAYNIFLISNLCVT